MKNKAFSLVEIIVAVAIIATLSGLIGLKLKDHIAKAKDTKALSSLNTLRIAIQIYQVENSEALYNGDPTEAYSKQKVSDSLKKLEKYLENNAKTIIDNPELEIGGSQTESDRKIVAGGKVRITFKNPNSTGVSDGYSIWLEPFGNTKELDIRGNKWTEY